MVISCDVLMANFQQNYVSIYMFIYLFILMLYDITSVCLVVKTPQYQSHNFSGGLGWFPYPGLRKLTPQHKNQLLRV